MPKRKPIKRSVILNSGKIKVTILEDDDKKGFYFRTYFKNENGKWEIYDEEYHAYDWILGIDTKGKWQTQQT